MLGWVLVRVGRILRFGDVELGGVGCVKGRGKWGGRCEVVEGWRGMKW